MKASLHTGMQCYSYAWFLKMEQQAALCCPWACCNYYFNVSNAWLGRWCQRMFMDCYQDKCME